MAAVNAGQHPGTRLPASQASVRERRDGDSRGPASADGNQPDHRPHQPDAPRCNQHAVKA